MRQHIKIKRCMKFRLLQLHQAFLHADTFISHTDAFTHRLLHTHTRFCIQTLLHTWHFYTQMLLHTDAFTHRRFYRQTHSHTPQNRNFTSILDHRPAFRPKGLRGNHQNSNFTSILDNRSVFRPKGLCGNLQNRNFTSFFDDRASFRAKGLP